MAKKKETLEQARARLAKQVEGMRLNCDAIDSKPIDCDWREMLGEDCEGWRSYEAEECDECHAVIVRGADGEAHHQDVDPETTCDGYVGCPEGPMMNYWYPVRIRDCEAAAKELAHLPLCVVEFRDGTTGLALTGGGMDLSWEICSAFFCLGFYPPVHFSLPSMCGRGLSERDMLLAEACKESARIAAGWAQRSCQRIDEAVAWAWKHEEDRRREDRKRKRQERKAAAR